MVGVRSCSWDIGLSFSARDIAGQLYPEGTPGPGRTHDGDLAIVGLGHLLDEREAEAEAPHIHLARIRGPPELLEDTPLGLRGDADAAVLDLNPDGRRVTAEAHIHPPARRRVADRVG